jgi:hypothetical protein
MKGDRDADTKRHDECSGDYAEFAYCIRKGFPRGKNHCENKARRLAIKYRLIAVRTFPLINADRGSIIYDDGNLEQKHESSYEYQRNLRLSGRKMHPRKL